MRNGQSSTSKWTGVFIVAGLFLLALSIRVMGLDYGYFLGDERVNYAAKVLTGQLVPDQHFYPPLYNYLSAVVLACLFVVGQIAGWWQGTDGFRAQYFADPTLHYLAIRFFTAMLAAAIAPLFYAIARTLSFDRKWAALVGLFGALTPVTVYLSHIAKSDVPLTTATILCVWVLLLRLKSPNAALRYDLALGASMVLAVSFKQSFLFFALPFLCLHGLMILRDEGLVAWLTSWAAMLVVAVLVWPVLNIGILLDLENFIAYQKIQAVMSVREGDGLSASLRLWLTMAANRVTGINAVMVVVFFALPAVWFVDRKSLPRHVSHHVPGLWGVALVAMLLVVWVARLRQPEGLWISFFTVMQLVAALGLVAVLKTRFRIVAGVVAVAALGLSISAVGTVWQQTRATPITSQVAEHVRATYAERRMFSTIYLGLPLTREVLILEEQRITRLAQKYGVSPPERAVEKSATDAAAADGFHIRSAPQVMFGLENASESDLKGIVQPFAWPVQPEEWDLGAWRDTGYDVFIVANLKFLAEHPSSAPLRVFYAKLRKSCDEAARFTAQKPLFLEFDVTILDCSDAG